MKIETDSHINDQLKETEGLKAISINSMLDMVMRRWSVIHSFFIHFPDRDSQIYIIGINKYNYTSVSKVSTENVHQFCNLRKFLQKAEKLNQDLYLFI